MAILNEAKDKEVGKMLLKQKTVELQQEQMQKQLTEAYTKTLEEKKKRGEFSAIGENGEEKDVALEAQRYAQIQMLMNGLGAGNGHPGLQFHTVDAAQFA